MTNEVQIVHLHLAHGGDVIGEPVGETKTIFDVLNPMSIEFIDEAIVLRDFLPYSEYKVCQINKSAVVSVADVHPDFKEYYYNALKYSRNVIQPSTIDTVKKVNKILHTALSKDNLDFAEAAKRYNVDLKNINNTKPN